MATECYCFDFGIFVLLTFFLTSEVKSKVHEIIIIQVVMEKERKEPFTITIQSIKISVKLKRRVELARAIEKCSEMQGEIKEHSNFIVFHFPELEMEHYNPNTKFSLYRYPRKRKPSSFIERSSQQHCNICGLLNEDYILPAINLLAKITSQKLKDCTWSIDNYNSLTTLPMAIDKMDWMMANENLWLKPETFPALVTRYSIANVTLLLSSTGSCVLSGGRKPADLEEACNFLKKCYATYLNNMML